MFYIARFNWNFTKLLVSIALYNERNGIFYNWNFRNGSLSLVSIAFRGYWGIALMSLFDVRKTECKQRKPENTRDIRHVIPL